MAPKKKVSKSAEKWLEWRGAEAEHVDPIGLCVPDTPFSVDAELAKRLLELTIPTGQFVAVDKPAAEDQVATSSEADKAGKE